MKKYFYFIFLSAIVLLSIFAPLVHIVASSEIEPQVRWAGQNVSLQDVAWKPDDSYGLVVGMGGLVLKYDGYDFELLTTLGYDAYDASWKPDGSYALIVGSGGHATKYDEVTFTSLTTPTANYLRQVKWKPDGSYALLVGGQGTLIKYDGTTFAVIETYTTADFQSVEWDVSGSMALAIGASGTIVQYRHDDGEVYWLGEDIQLEDIAWNPSNTLGLIVGYGGLCLGYDGFRFSVLNDSLGFDAFSVDWKPDGTEATIVGSQGHITKHSGGAFESISSPTTNDLRAVSWRQDGSYALIAGASGTLLAFNGLNVAVIQSKTSSNLNAIGWDATSEKALIVGDSGNAIIFNAMNNKVYWLGQDISLTDIAWKPDNSYGLIVGYEGIVLHYDGTTFTRLITGLSGVLYDATWKPDGSYAVLVGSEGIAVKYDGVSFSSLPTVTTNNLNKIAWNPAGYLALVVGDGGTILKFDGTTFTPILPLMAGLTYNLQSVSWHQNGTYAVITGAHGVALRYDVTADKVYWLGHDVSLDTITWKPDGSYGLIVGEGGIVMKYDGHNFEPLVTGLATQLYDVGWNHAGTTAIIIGSEGIAVKYDGVSFLSLTTNTTNNLYEVAWSLDDSYALVVGSQGLVLKYEDGSFEQIPTDITSDLNGICWNATHALVVGNSGQVLSWNGTGFSTLESGTTRVLWDVGWKPDGSYALIVSEQGEVLKFDGSTFTQDSTGSSSDFRYDRCSLDWHPDGYYALITGRRSSSPYYCVWRYDGTTFTRYSLRYMPWGVSWRKNADYALIVGSAGEAVKYDGSSFAYSSSTTSYVLWDVGWKPDGSYALIVSEQGEVLKFDGSTFIYDSTGSSSDFRYDPCSLSWRPDGTYVLITGRRSSSPYYCVWRYDGTTFTRYSLRYMPWGVSWRSDSAYALILGSAGEVVRYDGVNLLYRSTSTSQILWDVGWKPDGSYALIVSEQGEVLKFDGDTFSYDSTGSSSDFRYDPCSLDWNPDGNYALITGRRSSSPYYCIWRYNGTLFMRFSFRQMFYGVSWRSDGNYALVVGGDGEVVRYDGASFVYLSSSSSRILWDVGWKPDGSYALIVSEQGEVLKFDGSTFIYDSTGSSSDFRYDRCSLDWNPDSLWCVITGRRSSSPYYCVWRYDGATFTRYDLRYMPWGVAWRKDGAFCLIVGSAGEVVRYDGISLLYHSTSTSQILWDVGWKPDGSYALIVSEQGEVLKFDGSTFIYDSTGSSSDFRYDPCSIDWHDSGIWCVITGRRSSSPYYCVWRYDGATFVQVPLDAMAWDVSFQPGGDYCVVVGDSGHAWTYDSINLLPISTGVTANLYGVAWKPGGTYALIVGEAGTVLKYDGLWVTTLNSGVSQDLKGVAWSQDGSYALLVGVSGTVLKFDGSDFTPLNSGVPEDLLSADFGTTAALIVGKSGRLIKYENETFTSISLSTTVDLHGVDWTPSGDYAVVTGADGRAWKVYLGPPPSPLSVHVAANPSSVVTGDVSTIMVVVRNDTIPVTGATIALRSSLGGSFSTVVDHGDGSYTSNYTAPVVFEISVDRIFATASKAGFAPGSNFVDVSVSPPAWPDFKISASPASREVLPGQSTTYIANITSVNDFNSPVSLSLSGIPPGASYTFDPEPVTPPKNGSAQSILTVHTELAIDPSNYTLVLTGSSGEITHWAIVTLVVGEIEYLEQIQKYFPYWRFSKNEKWLPTSFYFDDDIDVENNTENYDDRVGEWDTNHVYIHIAEDQNYVTVGYWLYYTYNDWIGSFDDHLHDWDSVMYVVLDKGTLNPVMVGYSHHIQISYLSWDDPNLLTINNHPVAYVAEGSHAAYSDPDSMALPPYFDQWSEGGITLGPENLTNWVIVGYCFGEREFSIQGESRWFCQVNHRSYDGTHLTPTEAIYDGKVYWPKKFPTGNPVLDLFTDWDEAPWHRPNTWDSTTPQGVIDKAALIAHSPVDLYMSDPEGRHVGVNATGHVEMQIPGTLYTGPDAEIEIIIVPNPLEGSYAVNVTGVETGMYNLTIFRTLNEAIVYEEEHNNVEIQLGETQEFSTFFDPPPTITHGPVTIGWEGQAIVVTATITDNIAVTEAILYYRVTGQTTYTSVTMSKSGDTYTGIIPAPAVTSAGVQYYINATDGINFVTHPATNPTTSPHTITVENLQPTAVILNNPADITHDSMKLSWTTNNDADFAAYEIYQSTSSGTLGTKIHNITDRSITSYSVTGLSLDTTYYFTIRVVDTAGLSTDSNQVSGKTNPSEDITPPTVSVSIDPSEPDTTQTVTFTVVVNDNAGGSGIANVTLYIDGSPVQTWTVAGTHTYTGGPYTEGTHIYYAQAFDNANNKVREPTTGNRQFTVSPPPQPISLWPILAITLTAVAVIAIIALIAKHQRKTKASNQNTPAK